MSMLKALQKDFDLNLVMKAFLVMALVVIPFSFIHEVGHAIPCYVEGKEFKMNIGLLGSSLTCIGDVDNKTVFRASGGLLASVTALIPYLVFRKTIDEHHPYISVVLLSMVVGQFTNMIFEIFHYIDYIDHGLISVYSIYMVQSISFIYFAHRFSKKRIKEPYLQTSFINHLEQSKNENRHEETIKSLDDYLQSVKATNYNDSKLVNDAIEILDIEIKVLVRQIQIKKLAGKLHELDREPSFAEKLHKIFKEINLARDIIFDDVPYHNNTRLDKNKTNQRRRESKQKIKNNSKLANNDYGFNLNDGSYQRIRKAWNL